MQKGISRGKWILLVVTSALLLLAIFNFFVKQPELQLMGSLKGSQSIGIPENVAKYQTYQVKQTQNSLQDQLNNIKSSMVVNDDAQYGICGDVDGTVAIRGLLKGQLVCPTDPEFDRTVKVFNSRVMHQLRPGAAIVPRHTDDIVIALYVGREWGMNVTIKDGGHNPAGHSISKDGLMIDMQYMNTVYLEEGNVVVSEGGARWRDVHSILAKNNRSMVAGGCPQVGVVGLILGGGVGWLSRNRGLASDRVLSLDIVFPNGTLATITKESNSELFWALRLAGGSNFGVVTKATFETFPVQETYFGGKWCIFVNNRDAVKNLMKKYVRLTSEIEDNRLTVDSFVGRLIPTRPPAAAHMDPSAQAQNRPASFCFAVFFDGPIEDGKKAMKPLLEMFAEEIINENYMCSDRHPLCPEFHRKLSPQQIQKQKELMVSGAYFDTGLTYVDWLKQFGMDYIYAEWISLFFNKDPPDELAEVMATYLTDIKTMIIPRPPMAQIQVAIEHVGGAMSCEVRDESEFWPHCKAGFMISIQAFMHDDDKPPSDASIQDESPMTKNYIKTWTNELYQKMYKLSDGAYGNYADPDQKNWEIMYYGEDGYKRLQKVKKSIEGWEIFRAPQTIDPNSEISGQLDENMGEIQDSILVDWQQEVNNNNNNDQSPQNINDTQQNFNQQQISYKEKIENSDVDTLEKQQDENFNQNTLQQNQEQQQQVKQEVLPEQIKDDQVQSNSEQTQNTQQQENQVVQQNQDIFDSDNSISVNKLLLENQQQTEQKPRPKFRTFDPELHANLTFAIGESNQEIKNNLNIQKVDFTSSQSSACSQWVQDLASVVTHLESTEKLHSTQKIEQQQKWIQTIKYQQNQFVDESIARTMSGTTVLITGGTGGLGQSTALALAILGAEIIITSRSESGCLNGVARLENALEEYMKIFNDEEKDVFEGVVKCEVLELQDVDSIDALAGRIRAVDVVILNAGYLGPFAFAKNPKEVSAPLMVDHLGHFLLTSLLLDSNKINKPGRIILVSSGAFSIATQDGLQNFLNSVPYSDSEQSQSYLKQDEMGTYAAGKLSNMLFMRELDDRFNILLEKGVFERRFPITVNVAVPTLTVPTQLVSRLQTHDSWVEQSEKAGAVSWGSPAEGAMATVFLAAESTASHMSGKILNGCSNLSSGVLQNLITKSSQCMVWSKSQELLGLNQRLQTKSDVGQMLLTECITST